jgi:signal transduction histidine kinase/CheY-like chemotaxis protein
VSDPNTSRPPESGAGRATPARASDAVGVTPAQGVAPATLVSGSHAVGALDVGSVNLLLVDDRPENLLALEAILEPLGERLIRANSGSEALKQVLQHDFAVILLDVQMPGLNGFETAQIIKSRDRSRSVPIIFLTAISKEEAYVFKGYEVGAVDYMSKPFQPDILRSKVAVFVELYRKQQQVLRQEQLLRDSERREMELRHQARISEAESRMAEVVGSAMDAIITFDGDYRITLFNAAAERMFCLTAGEAIGRSAGELFPEARRVDYLTAMCANPSAGAAATAAASDCEPNCAPPVGAFTAVRADGEEFPLEASVSCLDLRSSKVYTLIGRDISERVAAEEALRTQTLSLERATAELQATNEELQERQAQLEEAMRARNRFYASMSHELRTPINAIIGYNTLLLDNIYGELNDRQTQGLQRTHKAAKHLLELVNDVLDLSKIEAGKIDLALQPVAFPALVEELFVTMRPMADEHGSALALVHDGDPITVVTDPRRVRQIVLNLLSNAIKFGRGRPITVECRHAAEEGVLVSVTDEGLGIAPDDVPRIFDEFVQLTHPSPIAGTGLGLPISRRLAGLLGGSLDVASTPDVGSTFTLTLPRTVPRAQPAAGRRGSAEVPAGEAVSVERAEQAEPATAAGPRVASAG